MMKQILNEDVGEIYEMIIQDGNKILMGRSDRIFLSNKKYFFVGK